MSWRYMLGVFGVAATAALVLTSTGCPPGQGCRTNEDCADGQVCAPDDEAGTTECVRPCAADLECAAGLACVPRDDGSYEGGCLTVTGRVEVGESCELDRDCRSGACEGFGSPVCAEQCTGDNTCDDAAMRCVLAGLRRVCVEPTGEGAAGDACTDSRACASGTCVDPPDPAEGEASPPVCADTCTEATDCPRDGDACVRLQGGARACLEPLADGATCQADSACAGGFCLEDVDGALKCASACVDDACDEGFLCVDDSEGNRVCLPRLDERAAGEPCTSARECTSGHCAHFATATEELGTLCADPCDEDGQCTDGLVCWTDEGGTDVCGPAPPG
ncbi:MAG: hypothetical protein IT383_05855 [Deltaproteobacteria bacterium]|nr:hypothetical protein [Deltaproteobacteria bacterium]